MNDLEKRVAYQEDIQAIRHLKHHYYCHCVDRAVAGEAAAIQQTVGKFTADIVADFTGFPLFDGLEAVTAFYAESVPAILSYSQHQVCNDVIEVDGNRASGRWYVNCLANFRTESPFGQEGSGLIAGRYEEEYERTPDGWKWRKITALLDVFAQGDSLWAGASQLFNNVNHRG